MKSSIKLAGLALGGFLVVSLGLPAAAQEKPMLPPLPKGITWKLRVLDEEPIRVVSAEFDPKNRLAFWVIELVRDFDVYEDGAHWGPAFKEGNRPRFRFELHDADGIVLKTVDGRYVGDYVNKAGKRFGVALVLPPELVLRIRTVEAVGK
jgi:hypothetical protein